MPGLIDKLISIVLKVGVASVEKVAPSSAFASSPASRPVEGGDDIKLSYIESRIAEIVSKESEKEIGLFIKEMEAIVASDDPFEDKDVIAVFDKMKAKIMAELIGI